MPLNIISWLFVEKTIFTYILRNLQMGLSLSVTLNKAGKACRDKHTSLLGPFLIYEENKVL